MYICMYEQDHEWRKSRKLYYTAKNDDINQTTLTVLPQSQILNKTCCCVKKKRGKTNSVFSDTHIQSLVSQVILWLPLLWHLISLFIMAVWCQRVSPSDLCVWAHEAISPALRSSKKRRIKFKMTGSQCFVPVFKQSKQTALDYCYEWEEWLQRAKSASPSKPIHEG